MTFAPQQVYSRDDSERAGLAGLKVLGDRELPDATITEAEKRTLREEIHAASVGRSVQACMFLAGAWEEEAGRKRVEERRGKAS